MHIDGFINSEDTDFRSLHSMLKHHHHVSIGNKIESDTFSLKMLTSTAENSTLLDLTQRGNREGTCK